MRTIIGLLALTCLAGCTLRDPAGFAAHQRSYQLDQRFEAMERQRQADSYAGYQRHYHGYIINGDAWTPY